MAGFNHQFSHTHILLDSHDYWLREDGILFDSIGHFIGTISESVCGEYRILEDDDGDLVASCHENDQTDIELIRSGIPTLAGY